MKCYGGAFLNDAHGVSSIIRNVAQIILTQLEPMYRYRTVAVPQGSVGKIGDKHCL